MFKFIARVFRNRSATVMTTRRAQWAAVKAVAALSGDPSLLASIADAEQRAHDVIANTYGVEALSRLSEKQSDELSGVALRFIEASAEYSVSFEVHQELARIIYSPA